MTGTLQRATFWCTKRAAGSPGSTGRRSATIRKFRATARWQRQIQHFSRFSSRGWLRPGRKSHNGEGEEFFREAGMKAEWETPDQLLHLVFGGELSSLDKVRFRDLHALDIVGIYPNYAAAYAAWKER